MTRYSITRKRNNKKYKKSRTGRGKGRRSIRRCKTRKPKGFKKAKRYTVGKRRRMVGGVFENTFIITPEAIYPYLARKNQRFFSDDRKKDFILVGFGVAMITKESAFVKENNRVERVAIFRQTIVNQGQDKSYIFVIARCVFRDTCFADSMETTIVVQPSTIMASTLDTNELVGVKNKLMRFETMVNRDNIDTLEFTKYTFPNMLSPSDTYKVVLLSGFTKMVDTENAIREYFSNPDVISLIRQLKTAQTRNPPDLDNIVVFTTNLLKLQNKIIPLNDKSALDIYKIFSPTLTIVSSEGASLSQDYPKNIWELFSFINKHKDSLELLGSLPSVSYPVVVTQPPQPVSRQSGDSSSTGLGWVAASSFIVGLA